MNRIFISYRSSDGKKDADRLCADLCQLFGDEQVFFDKQDLVGGTAWRDAIAAALGTRPLVLLLITPDLFGAQAPDGTARIDQREDPIRNELLTAHQMGAVVLPLLTEGVDMPAGTLVPAALAFISEAHALRLRTDDWNHDIKRLVEHLRAHGIAPGGQEIKSAPASSRPDRRSSKLRYLGAGALGLVVLSMLWPDTSELEDDEAGTVFSEAGLATLTERHRASDAQTSPQAEMGADYSGVWWLVDAPARPTRVHISFEGNSLRLQSDGVPVHQHPDWQAFALQLRDRGMAVSEVRYLAAGTQDGPHLQLAYEVYSGNGEGPLDKGSIRLTASADGLELAGQLWSNGEQAHSPLRLVRRP